MGISVMIVFCHVFKFPFGLEIDGRLMSASEDEDSGVSVTSYAQVSTQQLISRTTIFLLHIHSSA